MRYEGGDTSSMDKSWGTSEQEGVPNEFRLQRLNVSAPVHDIIGLNVNTIQDAW